LSGELFQKFFWKTEDGRVVDIGLAIKLLSVLRITPTSRHGAYRIWFISEIDWKAKALLGPPISDVWTTR